MYTHMFFKHVFEDVIPPNSFQTTAALPFGSSVGNGSTVPKEQTWASSVGIVLLKAKSFFDEFQHPGQAPQEDSLKDTPGFSRIWALSAKHITCRVEFIAK